MREIQPGDFDPALHSGPRITIMSRMILHRSLRFQALQKSTGLTSGNLHSHLRVLEVAGYVTLEETSNSATPRQTVHVTEQGDAALRAYVERLRPLLADLSGALGGEPGKL